MSFSNQTNLPNGQGSLLQILYTAGVKMNVSRSFPEWDVIRKLKVSKSKAREAKFMIQAALGYAAIQGRNPGASNRAFPRNQNVDLSEKTAQFKEIDVTLEVPYQVIDAEKDSPEKYASLLAIEIDSKATAQRRLMTAKWYLDGTGVHGTTSAVPTVSGGFLTVNMSTANTARGHAGAFEVGDLFVPYSQSGTRHDAAVTAVDVNPADSVNDPIDCYKVVSRNHRTGDVVFRAQSYGSAANTYADLSATGAGTITTNDVWYRIGQQTIPDLTSIADYDTASEDLLGLEAFSANDGRVVQGITMSGQTAGTRYDHQGAAISMDVLQQLLSDGKIAVGDGVYKWPIATMHPQTLSALIRERETDRRIISVDDNKRGVKFLAYQHEDDTVRLQGREFCAPKRIYLLPEPMESDQPKPLAMYGTDFTPVREPGSSSDWRLKATSNGYVAAAQSFLHSRLLYLSTHPAAILCAHNFTNT
jgi:hypothetical protein